MSILLEMKQIVRQFLGEEEEEGKEDTNIDKDGNRIDPKPVLKKEKDKEEPQKDEKDKEKPKKVSQEDANYIEISTDPDKICSLCIKFVTPSSCHKVEGEVSPDGLCRFFEKKTNNE